MGSHTPELRLSFPNLKRQEHDTCLGGTRGPSSISYTYPGSLQRPISLRGPQCNWVTTRECFGGRRGGGGRSKRAKLYPFLESDFPLHWGVPTPALDPTSPPYRTTPGGLSISPLLPASPSAPSRLSDRAPERSRVSSSSGRVSAADPPAHPPAPRSSQPDDGRMPGRAGPPRLLPGLPARRAGGSVRSPAGGQSHKEEEEAGRDQGSALPTRGRKPLERGAARNSQPSTRHYRRSGDIKREDGAKDYRMHERPRHQRTSARAIVQGSCSRAPKKKHLRSSSKSGSCPRRK